MSIVAPTVVNRTVFEFKEDVTTVTMPRPVLNDTKTQQLVRINRQSRGLTRSIFTSSDWYKTIIFDYSFRNLTLTKKDELITFLDVRVGIPIITVDHLTIERTVYVVEVTPIEEKRNNQCSYTVGVIVQEVI